MKVQEEEARMTQRGKLLLLLVQFVVTVACTQAGSATTRSPATAAPTTTVTNTVPATVTEDGATRTLPEPAATPQVTGSLTIEEGRCCAGGVAGEPLAIDVAFSASSSAGEVTEMRTHTANSGCADATQMEGESWQPFAPTATFSFTPPINWVTFYVTVEFRDGAGNLSPAYCGSVAVEGEPAP
jgi:hypothetical protein